MASNNLSNIDNFKNENINIFIGSASYDTLIEKYVKDLKNAEENKESSSNNPMEVWNNFLSRNLMICVDNQKEDGAIKDTGKYELVIFNPEGKPIKIGPSFSDVHPEQFKLEPVTDDKKGNFYRLSINEDWLKKFIKENI